MNISANIKFQRIKDTLLFTLRVFAPSVAGFLISLIVVNYFSKELWGSVVNISLWVFLFVSITSWGSKDYLLLNFSKEIANMNELFKQSFFTRLLLLPFSLLAIFFIVDFNWLLGIYASVWLILRFVSASYEPLVLFHKQFGWMIFIEITGTLLFICLFFVFKNFVNTAFVILLMTIMEFYKISLLVLINRKIIYPKSFSYFNIKHFTLAFPFFLMGVIGFLNSRIDQLLANLFLNNSEKALCQVYITLLIAAISVPALIIIPFVKNLYRAKTEIFKKVWLLMINVGILFAPLSAFIIWLVVKYLYHFEIEKLYFFAGLAYCFPAYVYIPILYFGYKNNKQKSVLIIFLICLVVISISGFFIIPIYASLGTIFNAAFGQWLILVLMLFFLSKSIHRKSISVRNAVDTYESPLENFENERMARIDLTSV